MTHTTKNHCIACKRGIALEQKSCHFCGTSQNFVRHYIKKSTLFLLLVAVLTISGYQYFQQLTKQAKIEIATQAEEEMLKNKKTVQQLEILLQKTKEKLEQAQQKIKQTEENKQASSSQANTIAIQFKQKIKAAEAETKKQIGRAGWLSKENKRLKLKNAELEKQINTQEQPSNTAKKIDSSLSSSTDLIDSLKQKLSAYENRKQILLTQIESKKKQLENNWQTSNETELTAETFTQHEQQIKQATQNEINQIEQLDNEIEILKKSILLAEKTDG